MHPLSHKPFEETLPFVCYCAKFRCKNRDEEAEKALVKEQKLQRIHDTDLQLKTMIKKYKGRYYGTSYLYDAQKAEGLLKTSK